MLIMILDSNFKILDILRQYTFCQYEDKFRGIGEFKIDAKLVDENLFLLEKNKDFYILFDTNIVGKIECISKESDSEFEKIIELSGRFTTLILTKRIIKGTLNLSGTTAYAVEQLIKQNVVSSGDTNRNINIGISYDNKPYIDEICSQISKQYTGGYVWDEVLKLLEQDKLGIFFTPEVKPTQSYNGVESNITKWNLTISAGADRTKGNLYGNRPIIFSQSLSNIERTEYEEDNKKYCNVAYVASEGDRAQRKWYELNINDDDTIGQRIGWNRNELWIDARDIQSEDSGGNVIPQPDYDALITKRANEKAVENKREESYTSTLTEVNRQYVYGQDYKNGDFVTIIDNELNITVDAQIVEITRSVQGVRELIDIVLEYGKIKRDPLQQIANIGQESEQNKNAIKYIETKIQQLSNGSINKTISSLYLTLHPVGSIVMSTSPTNPGTIYGGTWERWGQGRVPVGVDTSDANFNTVEKTGGIAANNFDHAHITRSVGLTVDQLPPHSHSLYNKVNHILYDTGIDDTSFGWHAGTSTGYRASPNSAPYLIGVNNTGSGQAHNHGNTENALSMVSNLQPYITCYMWKRTA